MKSEPVNPYALETCFDRRALQRPEGRRKAQLFSAMIPEGCESILDAGGGTGWATLGIRNICRVVTLDNCRESLNQAEGETVFASVDNLPLENHSFDLILSSQVLEHLPNEVLKRTCEEMDRVARKFLLVSVPYREFLKAKYVRCVNCGKLFHPDYHCQSFDETTLAKLFPDWVVAEWHVFGRLSWGAGVTDSWRLTGGERRYLRNVKLAGVTTICPQCGKRGGDTKDNECPPIISHSFLQRLQSRANGLRNVLGSSKQSVVIPQEIAPYWIAMLFVRGDSDLKVDGRI